MISFTIPVYAPLVTRFLSFHFFSYFFLVSSHNIPISSSWHDYDLLHGHCFSPFPAKCKYIHLYLFIFNVNFVDCIIVCMRNFRFLDFVIYFAQSELSVRLLICALPFVLHAFFATTSCQKYKTMQNCDSVIAWRENIGKIRA